MSLVFSLKQTGVPLGSMLAGAIVPLVFAVAYAGLAGWGVPAQRTVFMLALLVVLRSAGVRWPWPLVLLAAAVVVTALHAYGSPRHAKRYPHAEQKAEALLLLITGRSPPFAPPFQVSRQGLLEVLVTMMLFALPLI